MKYIKKKDVEAKSKDIQKFSQALKHFIFSYASFTNTGYVYTTIWNWWFVTRSFVLRPSTWYTFLAYPNYYDKIVRPVESVNLIIPTKFNGGTQPRFSNSFAKLDKEKLKSWEEKVFVLEEKVHNEAIKKSFLALSAHIKKDSHLKELLENGTIKSIFDHRVGELKKKQQIFFQNVFQGLFNQSMEKLLKQVNLVQPQESFEFKFHSAKSAISMKTDFLEKHNVLSHAAYAIVFVIKNIDY